MSQLYWLKEISRSVKIGEKLQQLAGHRSTKANEEIWIGQHVRLWKVPEVLVELSYSCYCYCQMFILVSILAQSQSNCIVPISLPVTATVITPMIDVD